MDEKLFGLPLPFFAAVSVIVIRAGFLGKLESKSMVCGRAVCMVVGYWLSFIANKVGIIRQDHRAGLRLDHGGGTGVFQPDSREYADPASAFMNDTNFLAFYIAALLCGSILGMDRKLLIQAGARYFIPIIGGVVSGLRPGQPGRDDGGDEFLRKR